MSATTTIAYVGNADSAGISTIALAPDGTLALVDTTPAPGLITPGASLPLALSPDRTRLFAAIRAEPYAVLTYAIAPGTGRLKLLGSGPLPDSMAYIATDRSGRFLFGASYGGSKVSVSPIGTDGIVGAPLQVEATFPKAHAILSDPSNRFVLATSLGGELVHQWRLDTATGRLTLADPATAQIPSGSGPRHLIFSPDARFAYVLGELDAAVHVLPWDAESGTLGAPIQSISALPPGFTGTPWAADIHLTPDGRFLYASERTSSTLAAFGVDATGRLIAIGSTATETQPRGFAIDPSGHHLLATGQLSHHLTSYAIDQGTGTLAPVSRIAVGQNPNWVEIIAPP